MHKIIPIIFTLFLYTSQIYWLPFAEKDQLDILKILLLSVTFFLTILFFIKINRKDTILNLSLLFFILIIIFLNFDLGIKLFLIYCLYLISRLDFKLNKYLIFILTIFFLLPSFSYFFSELGNYYIPYKHFDTHFAWNEFYEVGFGWLSTGYGYSLAFITAIVTFYFDGKLKLPLQILCCFASFCSGSLLSITFVLFIILIFIKKIKLLFLLIIIFITQYFITTEQFYHLGNSRFEMYNMLGDIKLAKYHYWRK